MQRGIEISQGVILRLEEFKKRKCFKEEKKGQPCPVFERSKVRAETISLVLAVWRSLVTLMSTFLSKDGSRSEIKMH
jgi:hypothetical protein